MEHIYDLIIIGAGPAGLTAAIYGIRARLDLLVIEREMLPGGQVLNTSEVDNYPGLPAIGGYELSEKFREHAERLGAAFVNDSMRSLEFPGGLTETGDGKKEASKDGTAKKDEDAGFLKRVVCDGGSYLARTVIIATGTCRRKLGIPGEEALAGMGVSYCAVCDGAFYRNKVTAVVGGGDTALEDALYLSRLCEKVYLIHRRDTFRGARSLQSEVQRAERIVPLMDTVAVEVTGSGRTEGLRIRNVKTGEERELQVDGVFAAVGTDPDTGIFSGVPRDPAGYLIAGETCETSVPGVYAAGDIRSKRLRQILTAAADGANAVESAVGFLQGKGLQ